MLIIAPCFFGDSVAKGLVCLRHPPSCCLKHGSVFCLLVCSKFLPSARLAAIWQTASLTHSLWRLRTPDTNTTPPSSISQSVQSLWVNIVNWVDCTDIQDVWAVVHYKEKRCLGLRQYCQYCHCNTNWIEIFIKTPSALLVNEGGIWDWALVSDLQVSHMVKSLFNTRYLVVCRL